VCIVLRATYRTYGAQESRDEGIPARPGKSCARVQWPNRFVRKLEEVRWTATKIGVIENR